MRRLLSINLVIFCFVILVGANAFAGSATLRWQANSESDLSGYNVYCGQSTRSYDPPIPVGKQTSYTFTGLGDDAECYFAVTSLDNAGNESGYSTEVSKYIAAITPPDPVDPPATDPTPPTDPVNPPQLPFNMEYGRANVDQRWTKITFQKNYINPVVIAKQVTEYDVEPAVVRMRNLSKTGFEVRIQEWNYLDGKHGTESIHYFIMEAGRYALEGGSSIEAGFIDTNKTNRYEYVSFGSAFNQPPIIFSTVSTYNGSHAVTCRIKNVNASGFNIGMQEQEIYSPKHKVERLAYVAIEPTIGTIGSTLFQVDRTPDAIRHKYTGIAFKPNFTSQPIFLMDMQTADGGDTSNVCSKDLYASGVSIKIKEEQSRDSETYHTTESVGFLVLSD